MLRLVINFPPSISNKFFKIFHLQQQQKIIIKNTAKYNNLLKSRAICTGYLQVYRINLYDIPFLDNRVTRGILSGVFFEGAVKSVKNFFDFKMKEKILIIKSQF